LGNRRISTLLSEGTPLSLYHVGNAHLNHSSETAFWKGKARRQKRKVRMEQKESRGKEKEKEKEKGKGKGKKMDL
jgi:hypothetical protein